MAELRHAMPLVSINAPEWFDREDFMRWVNHPNTMTWHSKGHPPNEYADTITYHGGDCEGSDYPCGLEFGGAPGIPEDIWQEINVVVGETLGNANIECWVHITNLEG